MGRRRDAASRLKDGADDRTGCYGSRGCGRCEPLARWCGPQLAFDPATAPGALPSASLTGRSACGSLRGGIAFIGKGDRPAPVHAAVHVQGCRDAGAIPGLWYVNLAYFTGPIRDAEQLIGWVEARRKMEVADVRVTRLQIAGWQYTATGMVPTALAAVRRR